MEWINNKVPLILTVLTIDYSQYPIVNHSGKNMKKNIYIYIYN